MKQCPQCRNTYPDNVEFCMHEGTRLVPAGTPLPEAPPPKKGIGSKVLLGCGIVLVLVMGSCAVGMYKIMSSPEFKKEMAENEARREKEAQQRAEQSKRDAEHAVQVLAALHSNFPPEGARRESTCTIANVEKSLAGDNPHLSEALYVDYDFLARFLPNAPQGEKAPGWPWLTSPSLRDWSPSDSPSYYSPGNLSTRYIVVILNQGVTTPILREDDFVGGQFRGWAVLYDGATLAALGQTAIQVRNSKEVDYKTRGPKSGREYQQQAIDDDFREQFKAGLEKSMERMCPKLSLSVSLP